MNTNLQKSAKKLRKDSTITENLLWKHLRAKNFKDLKWRRQEVIEPYIVDFVCYEKRVIVECDGGQHSEQALYDSERDIFLKSQGFKVLRFWNNVVLNSLQDVLETIHTTCFSPSPQPPPVKGGGKENYPLPLREKIGASGVCASIALGTNLGDKLVNLKNAITEIKKIPFTTLLKQSSIFETEPLTKNGENPQDIPSYYNAALLVSTTLSATDLFYALCNIEKKMGRTEKHNWQPRLIDLDLLFYNDMVLNTPELTLPHPELHTRTFALNPLAEISPNWIHPLTKKTVAQMAKTMEGSLKLKQVKQSW